MVKALAGSSFRSALRVQGRDSLLPIVADHLYVGAEAMHDHLTDKDIVYVSERQLRDLDFTPVYHRHEQCSEQIPAADRIGLAKLWADRIGRGCALCLPPTR